MTALLLLLACSADTEPLPNPGEGSGSGTEGDGGTGDDGGTGEDGGAGEDGGTGTTLAAIADLQGYDGYAAGDFAVVQGVVLAPALDDALTIADAAGAWSGIRIYASGLDEASFSTGDLVEVGGELGEYYDLTQLDASDGWITVLGSGNALPAPVELGAAEAGTEAYESCLVTVLDATVTNLLPDAPDDFGEFQLDWALRVDDLYHDAAPRQADRYDRITGVLTYSYGDYKLAPRDADDLARAEQPRLSVGSVVSCTVDAEGQGQCWGEVRGTWPGEVTWIDAGWGDICALSEAGEVSCYGGIAKFEGQDPPDGTYSSVSVGGLHACVVDAAGEVQCWGNDSFGQASPPGDRFISISAADAHTCGLDATGEVLCWGDDSYGQASPPAGTFVSVSTSLAHTCGVDAAGQVRCWGRDDYGQASPPAGTFVSVSAGWFHTCAVDLAGAVHCWGDDSKDQSSPPTASFAAVGGGSRHTCGVDTTGAVQCWGDNSFGQCNVP